MGKQEQEEEVTLHDILLPNWESVKVTAWDVVELNR